MILELLVQDVYKRQTHGTTTTAEVLDDIKAMGYKYSTRAAMTVSISEMTVPPVKKQLLAEAEKKVEQITVKYNRGQATDCLLYTSRYSCFY